MNIYYVPVPGWRSILAGFCAGFCPKLEALCRLCSTAPGCPLCDKKEKLNPDAFYIHFLRTYFEYSGVPFLLTPSSPATLPLERPISPSSPAFPSPPPAPPPPAPPPPLPSPAPSSSSSESLRSTWKMSKKTRRGEIEIPTCPFPPLTCIDASMRSSGFCMHSSQRFSLEPDCEFALLAAPDAAPDPGTPPPPPPPPATEEDAPPAPAPPGPAAAPPGPTGLPRGPEKSRRKARRVNHASCGGEKGCI